LIIKYQSYYNSKNQKTIIKQQVKQKNTNRYIQALTAGHTHLHRLSHHFEENTQRNTREKPEKQAFLGGIFEFQFSPTESVENASHTKTGQSKRLPNLQWQNRELSIISKSSRFPDQSRSRKQYLPASIQIAGPEVHHMESNALWR
jgi:hypothetical protein